MSMRKGEQIVGHVPRELPMKIWQFLDTEGEQLVKPLEEESKEMDWKYLLCSKGTACKEACSLLQPHLATL